jgi:hypothetical protein
MTKHVVAKETSSRRTVALVTPTDLGATASRDIAGGMNAVLADAFARRHPSSLPLGDQRWWKHA